MEPIFFYFSLFLASLILMRLFSSLLFRNKNTSSLPPSPPSLPFIGHLHLLKQPFHLALAGLSARYGPILLLRFGIRRVLVVSSHSFAEECFTKNDLAFANRPCLPSSKRLTYNHTTLAMAPYGSHWRNLRRLPTSELLSSSRLNSLSEVRLDEVRWLVATLFREYCANSDGSQTYLLKVELKSRFFELALNVVMRMISGKRYYGDEVKDSEEAKMFRGIIEEALRLVGTHISDFLPILRWVDFRGLKKKVGRALERREETLQGLIDEQRWRNDGRNCDDERSKTKTMVEVMLSLQKEDPEYYTDELIKAQIIVSLDLIKSQNTFWRKVYKKV